MLLKIIRYPLTRLIIGVALLIASQFGAAFTENTIDGNLALEDGSPLGGAIELAYWVLVRLVEGRRVSELSASHALPELVTGLLLAVGFISAVVGILFALGHFEITGIRTVDTLARPAVIAISAGFIEEFALRGIIFRITEEWLGSWIALFLSAALFGLMHLGNPNASLLAAFAIAIEAGVLLAAVYMVTRRLWVAIGLHIGWNFMLGGIYSGTVSGMALEGLLVTKFDGPQYLTGGDFGVEASVITMTLGVLLALYFLIRAHQKGHFIAPPWARG